MQLTPPNSAKGPLDTVQELDEMPSFTQFSFHGEADSSFLRQEMDDDHPPPPHSH